MFGAELSELFLFGRQLGLALAGAAALWGFVFTKWTRHHAAEKDCLVYDWIGEKLLLPLTGGIALFLLSWFFLSLFLPVNAHEGVSLSLPQDLLSERNGAAGPFLLLWLGILFLGFLFKKTYSAFFSRNMEWFYAPHFFFAFFLMFFFAWGGEWSSEQLFFLGHSVHSIFTLGTVLVLDFLFLVSQSSIIVKQHTYPLFPFFSKVIFAGLAIDFLSVTLIFEQALLLTPKFFFVQTVIAVLIINGTLLAGPLTRRILASVRQGGKSLEPSWEKMAGVAGVISIVSWSTVTFVDFFASLTLNYLELLGFYLLLILVFYVVHTVLERSRDKVPAFLEHASAS